MLPGQPDWEEIDDMNIMDMLANVNEFQVQHGPTQEEYNIAFMVFTYVAIFLAILAIVVIVKSYFAMKVKREILALIAEGKITADEAQKLMPKKSKL